MSDEQAQRDIAQELREKIYDLKWRQEHKNAFMGNSGVTIWYELPAPANTAKYVLEAFAHELYVRGAQRVEYTRCLDYVGPDPLSAVLGEIVIKITTGRATEWPESEDEKSPRKAIEVVDPQQAVLNRAQAFFANSTQVKVRTNFNNLTGYRSFEMAVPVTTTQETLQRIANGAYKRGAKQVSVRRPMNNEVVVSNEVFEVTTCILIEISLGNQRDDEFRSIDEAL